MRTLLGNDGITHLGDVVVVALDVLEPGLRRGSDIPVIVSSVGTDVFNLVFALVWDFVSIQWYVTIGPNWQIKHIEHTKAQQQPETRQARSQRRQN